MLSKGTIGICSFVLTFNLAAKSADFSVADDLFTKRDQSKSHNDAAKMAYQSIIDQGAQGADLVRAVDGLARTYLYEGSVLLKLDIPEDRAERKKVFNACWNKVADYISPAKLGYSHPYFWYLRATCLAQEAEVSNALERLLNLPKLLDAFENGLNTPGGDTIEGGGLKRVKAAVKGNPEAKGLPGGLYNPTEALQLINEAIDAEAYPGSVEGFFFCDNFRRKIQILNEIGQKDEAILLAQTSATDFSQYLEEGLIREVMRAETINCISELEKLK